MPSASPPRVVCLADNVVDCFASWGVMTPGGNALNVAVQAARLGARASYVGAVADDPAGRLIRRALAAEGVDVARLRVVPGRTAHCVIAHEAGERRFLRADLGVSIIELDAGDLDHVVGAHAVHTGRSSRLDDHLPTLAARAPLSYDFATVREPARVARVAPLCHLATFSGGDLLDGEAADLAGLALAAGARRCLVTRGAEGAELHGAGRVHRAPAARGSPVIDTLGAGDAVAATVLVGLLRGDAPEAVLADAMRLAARTCGHLGGFGHPAPIEVDGAAAVGMDAIYAGEPVATSEAAITREERP